MQGRRAGVHRGRGVGLRESRVVRIVQVRIGRRMWRLRRLEGIRRLSRGCLERIGPLGVHERVEMERLVRLVLLLIVGTGGSVVPSLRVVQVWRVPIVIVAVLGFVRLRVG